ncbi:MAG: hypothetical protein GX774_12740 [Armatimonadetes bacterium]|nr:hypothetical protein [Armatimonadota bacterium]
MSQDMRQADRRPVSDRPTASARRLGHLAAVLPRGEAIRNFVYTGALDEVAKQADLTVLSVAPSEEIWGALASRYPRVLPLRQLPERWTIGALRDILDMAHGRWLWSEAAQERWRLRDREATTAAARAKRLAMKLACYPFASRTGLGVLSRVERTASRWLRTTDEYVRLFQELGVSFLFNGSHVHGKIAIQAVQAAQWLKIPTATFIFSWDNLTSQGRVTPPYDYYLVWSKAIREQLLQIYPTVDPERVFVTGTPQFDFHFRPEYHWTREEFCERMGADPSRPILFYATGMANHMPDEPAIVESIADMAQEMDDLGRPQLLVRVYPKDQTGRFEELKRRRPDILFPPVAWEPAWLTPRVEDTPVLTNTLRHAAVGINVASTVSLELCMFDKPVVNIGYNPPGLPEEELSYARYYKFDHYRPVVESGAVQVASSPAELRTLVRQALLHPQERSAQRRALIERLFGNTLDGCSGHRVARVLCQLMEAEGS